MIYLELFITFFKIGLFGFGGGMAIFSLIQLEVVQHGWLTPEEIVDIMAISQVTPGPIGINCATYVGYTIGGIWGSVLTTFALVLPSLIIMLTVCRLYFWISRRYKGNAYFEQTLRMLRFTVIGLIASAALMLLKPTTFINGTSWVIFAVVALLTILPELHRNKLIGIISHPIVLIVLSGVAGYILYHP